MTESGSFAEFTSRFLDKNVIIRYSAVLNETVSKTIQVCVVLIVAKERLSARVQLAIGRHVK